MSVTVRRTKIVHTPISVYRNSVDADRPRSDHMHTVTIRDQNGEVVELAEFHGFEGRELDAALEAFVETYDKNRVLWGKLYDRILARTDPTFEYCQRPEPITVEDLMGW